MPHLVSIVCNYILRRTIHPDHEDSVAYINFVGQSEVEGPTENMNVAGMCLKEKKKKNTHCIVLQCALVVVTANLFNQSE